MNADEEPTDQKKLSDALERSARLFRVLAEHSIGGLGLRTLDGKYKYLSPSCEKYLGYPVEELMETGLVHTVHPDDRPAAEAFVKNSLNPDRDATFEPFVHRYVHKNGSVGWSETMVSVVPDPEDPEAINVLTTFHDVTDMVNAQEELKEANAIKDRFLGMATHDLRSPLVSIRALSELLKEGKGDDAQRADFIQSIHSTTQHMMDLLDDLLDVSAIESGQLDVRRKPTDLTDLVERRLRLQDVTATEKGIRIERDFAPVSDVAIDGPRMAQVIDNLLSNAIKFSSPETVITVSLAQTDGDVTLTVRDQGQGIPPDEQERIFLPFEKLSIEPTGGENSTGLGMFIVKQIVDAHGADIAVNSRPGEGTAVKVTLNP